MRRSDSLWLALGVLALQACAPQCDTVCNKIEKCAPEIGAERIIPGQCEESCKRENQLYDAWQDDSKIDAFEEQRRCVMQSSCDELADGACYDDSSGLYVYGDPPPGT